jgi:hypothetical protein
MTRAGATSSSLATSAIWTGSTLIWLSCGESAASTTTLADASAGLFVAPDAVSPRPQAPAVSAPRASARPVTPESPLAMGAV